MRRNLLRLGAGLLSGSLLAGLSQAQELPLGNLNPSKTNIVFSSDAQSTESATSQGGGKETGSLIPAGFRGLQAPQAPFDGNGDPLVMPPPVYAPEGMHWMGADLLLWWLKGTSPPPLLFSASPAGTPVSQAGVLGTPGAVVLFGGNTYNQDMLPGGRFTLGTWVNDEKTVGLEMYGLILPGCNGSEYTAGTPNVVSRPYVDATNNQNAAELVSYPGLLDGTSSASITTSGLYGAGVLGLYNLAGAENYRIDGVAGFRYLTIGDTVRVTENLTSIDPGSAAIPVGTNFAILDQFKTGSQFYGCDLGLRGEYRTGRWFVDGGGRIALGSTYQSCSITGNTTVTVPGVAPATSPGGLLALPSNIGSYSREVLTFVPEVGCHLGYFVTETVRLRAGYSFLYWSSVARAGNVINPNVNPNLLPPSVPGAQPAQPAFNWNGTGIWAQGIDLGLEWRF